MNKASIVDAVHGKLGGTKVQAEQAVETMIDTIVSALKKAMKFLLPASAFSQPRSARPARPATLALSWRNG
jgi:nucleoid DNA-binding protein